MKQMITFFRRVEGVIFRHILYIVLQRRFWQDEPLLVDFVDGILEGQLRTAILLVMSEYSTWKQSGDTCENSRRVVH